MKLLLTLYSFFPCGMSLVAGRDYTVRADSHGGAHEKRPLAGQQAGAGGRTHRGMSSHLPALLSELARNDHMDRALPRFH
jgi:hypothetical protein